MTKFTSRLKTPSHIRKQHMIALRRLKIQDDLRKLEEMADLKIPPVEAFETPKIEKKLKRPCKPRKVKTPHNSPTSKPAEVQEVDDVDTPETVEEPLQEKLPVSEGRLRLEHPEETPVQKSRDSSTPMKPLEQSKPKSKLGDPSKKTSRGPNRWTVFLKAYRKNNPGDFGTQMKGASVAWKDAKRAGTAA